MRMYKKDLSKYDYPKRSLIIDAFKHSRNIDVFSKYDTYVSRKIIASKFLDKLDNVEIDFFKIDKGKGYVKVGAWGQGPIVIKYIYDDYFLIRVEYKRLGDNKVYKSFERK